jgi:DNA polymerase III subunit delta'
MNFASLIGNQRIKQLLKRAVADGRIGQGLIFAGPSGIGKRQFALALAQAINCLRPAAGDACGECVTCRKFAAREFTDVKTITPDGQFIKIDQMREMSREAYFRPYEGRRRVYIIDGAERLREEAANSILKTLEEPPETSQIVLLTAKPYALLETIRSRCQLLNFAPLSYEEMEAYLQANYKRPLEETRLIARLARGSLGRALEIDLGEYKEKRATLMDLVEALLVTRDTVKLMQSAEYLGRKLDKEAFETHLDLLMTLLEDLFHLKLGEAVESLTNRDLAKRLEQAAEVASLERLTSFVGQLEKVSQNLPRNINRHIAMEAALLST